MEYRYRTKEFQSKQHVFVKIVADPEADETKWLPACAALSKTMVFHRSLGRQELNRSPAGLFFSTLATLLHAAVLSVGQISMVAAAACFCGSLASVSFGQSYERVMYHCGPQDTIVGVFTIFAVPLFWTGWFLYKHKYVKFALLLGVVLPLACLLGASVPGVQSVFIGVLLFVLLLSFLYCGSYLSSFKGSWPRRFKPTLWLSISYISAVVMLAREFVELDLSGTIERAAPSMLFYTAETVAGFAFLPAFLTAITSGTRRLASGIGLAVVGQLPMLVPVIIYCLANAMMLACVSIAGAPSIAEYFAGAPGGLTPDFDLASSNLAELSAKLLCSAMVWFSLILCLLAGSTLGVMWNRKRVRRQSDEFKSGLISG